MFIGHFTERPYQDPKSGVFGTTARPIPDLGITNEVYRPGGRRGALQPLPR